MTRRALLLGSLFALAACDGGTDPGDDAGPGMDAGRDEEDDAGPARETDAFVPPVPPVDAGSSGDAGPACDVLGVAPTDGPPAAGEWEVTFFDDFLAPTLDGDRWKLGQHWAGYNGMGATDADQIEVDCGFLTLRGEHRAASFAGRDAEYAAADISTYRRFRQLHGYFETRARFDGVRGLWPAFWLMPDRGTYGNVDQNRAAFLSFDVRDVPAGASRVTLELVVESAQTGSEQNLMVLGADDDWSADTLTGETRPSFDARPLDILWDPGLSAGERVELDVTAFVERERAGDGVASFALVDQFLRQQRIRFHSQEATDPTQRPRLVFDGGALAVLEDGTIGEGANAATSYAGEPALEVLESWGDTSSTYDGGMEIDILESLGQWGPDRTAHALHWDGYGGDHQSTGSGVLDLSPASDGFHTYGVLWETGRLVFFVDGVETWRFEDDRVGSVPAYVLATLQIGGWADSFGDNRVVDDASLPAGVVFDYVRVWARR